MDSTSSAITCSTPFVPICCGVSAVRAKRRRRTTRPSCAPRTPPSATSCNAGARRSPSRRFSLRAAACRNHRALRVWDDASRSRTVTQALRTSVGRKLDVLRGGAVARYLSLLPAMLETLWSDLRFGLRSLGRTPAFTVAALVTLALGIGANTAIFSLVNAVVLRTLPLAASQELVFVGHRDPSTPDGGVSLLSNPAWLQRVRQETGIFEIGRAHV